jgi:TonB-linked SusC/RagA family outer membrane protein
MKYIKIWVAFCVLFSCLTGNINAQKVNQVNSNSTILDSIGRLYFRDSASQQVNLPFRKVVNRRDVSGAVSVLNPPNYIDYDYNLSVQGGINGRVAGLIGTTNIWGLDNAIVMIDGIPRDYADITLSEVQQITVLKGVNAVALYGSQAAKGVILITTKKGEANTRKVSVRVNTGIATPVSLPNYLNSGDYMKLYNEARRNDGLPDLYDAATIQNYTSGNPYRYPSVNYYSSDYLKKFQNATDANAEFSGGNNTARFYSNIGYSNSSTLLKVGEGKNENDNRLNIRGNVDLKLNDKISSSIYVSAIFNDSRRAHSSVANTNYWSNAASLLSNRITPLIPISLISPNDKNSLGLVGGSRNVIDGKYLLGGTQQFQTNPIADLYAAGYDLNIRRTFQVTNAIDANLNSVLSGLSFHTLFNLDYTNSYLQSITNTYAVYSPTWSATSDSLTGLQKFGADARPGTQNINNTAQRQSIGFSAWFGYDKTINSNHNLSAKLLGYTSSVSINDIYQPITNSHLGLQFGYNYKHKYFADFSAAYVNSTKLPTGNRTGFSPTVNLGWLLSSERFLADARSVDYLKLSASAGIVKTDLDINGYYLYDNIYNRGASFSWNDGVQGTNQTSTSAYGASPNLTFPQRKEVNLSIDGSFFKNLLTLQTTYFISDMDGMPTQRFSQYPNYFTSFIPYTNYNSQRRTGFDVMLNLNKKVGDVQLSVGTTATYTTSKVTKRDELYFDPYQNRAGKPVDAIFGLVNEGFFNDQNDINTHAKQLFSEVKPGDIKYVDQNGDRVIDSRDEVMIGRFNSPFNYGVNLNVGYKNFNLFVLGTGSNGGNNIMNSSYYWVSADVKYSEVVLNRWTPATAQTATYPRLSSQQNSNDFRNSDFWIYKTDRFNLSKVQLTYNVETLKTSFVKGLLFYVSGANLYTFSQNRKILDLAVANTPNFRNYTVGIRAKF